MRCNPNNTYTSLGCRLATLIWRLLPMLELKGPAMEPSVGTTRRARPACKVEQIARNQLAYGTRRASCDHCRSICNIHTAVNCRFGHHCRPSLQINEYGFAAANQHALQHSEPPTDLRQSSCKAQSSLNTQRRCPNAPGAPHRPTRPLNWRLSWRLHAAAGLPGPCGRLPWLPVCLLCIKQSAHADLWHGKLLECVEIASQALLEISFASWCAGATLALMVASWTCALRNETMQNTLRPAVRLYRQASDSVGEVDK